jgi:hypothetical protein
MAPCIPNCSSFFINNTAPQTYTELYGAAKLSAVPEDSMLAAVSHLKPVGRGVTAPHLFAADDDETYVVKFQANKIGPKVLVNELLAARLGQRWDLCFPPGGLIYLSQEVLAKEPYLSHRVQPGVHFASRFLSGCRYLNRILLHKAVNKRDMAGVMLFDHLFHNVDRTRNPRNLLIRKETAGWRLYAIDHSHLFYRGRWTQESLNKLATIISVNHQRSFGVLLKHYLQADDFLPCLQKVAETNDADFAEVVNEIPREWLPGADERELLTNWLCQRRSYADEIVNQLCSLISPRL